MVGVSAIEQRCEVPRGVDRGSVALAQDARRELLLGQVDDERTFGDLGDACFLHHVDGGFHLVFVEALAGDRIELDAQPTVGTAERFEAYVAQALPQLARCVVPRFELLERNRSAFVERFVVLGFLLEAHVDVEQVPHRVRGQRVIAAPFVPRDHDLPELRTPVAEVIDAVHRVTRVQVQAP